MIAMLGTKDGKFVIIILTIGSFKIPKFANQLLLCMSLRILTKLI